MYNLRGVFVALIVVAVEATKSEMLVDSTTVSVPCPLGFVAQGNGCVCADWPDGMVVCDKDSQRASMMVGYCMTYDNETSEVRAGRCIRSYLRNDSYKFFYELPTEVSELDYHMCRPSNSRGLLCGECQEGFASSPLTIYDCTKCSATAYGWLKLIAFEYIPSTLVLAIIVTFAISAVSGPLNSFIFFSQVTTGGFINIGFVRTVLMAQGNSTTLHNGKTVVNVISGFYGIWNLHFFSDIISPFCLTEHLTKLQALVLEYPIVTYPLFLTVILYFCISSHGHNFRPIVYCWRPFHKYFIYFRRSVDSRTSVIDAFATFILLSYVKLLTVTTLLFVPTYLYSSKAQKLTLNLYFAPTVEAFHGGHLPITVTALFALLVFVAVPPLVLILYPTSVFQKCVTRCKINSQALRTFVETFNGCYKDGTNGTRDCRCFAGLYFLLRVVYLLSLVFNTEYYIFVLTILYLITAMLFALVQPYKIYIYNVVDTVIFCILAIMHIVIIAHTALILFVGSPSTPLLLLSDLLYSLPLLYFLLFCGFWLLDRKTGCTQKLRKYRWLSCFFQDRRELQRDHFDAGFPHRLLNPEEYEALTTNENDGQNYYGSATCSHIGDVHSNSVDD